jgi:hypothetical protein
VTDTFNPHTFHSRHPHLPRLILLALLALIVYLVWTETAAAEKRTLVVLSSDFQMKHYTAAGAIESEPAESEAACDSLRQGVSSAATSHPDLDVVTLPPLPADEQAAVDEHVALLNTIVDNIRFMAGTPGFKLDDDFGPQSVALHRYSMGDGLAFLTERCGADLALIVSGFHLKPTGGRRAVGLLLYGAIPPEGAGLSVAIADLETGELVWFQSIGDFHVTLFGKGGEVDDEVVTDPLRAEAMFDRLLATYQGGGG